MSIELHDDREAAESLDAGRGTSDRARPNVSGDLPSVLEVGPMFRRAVAGYDRFQVDTYVRWAEDELVAADRERAHLVARQLESEAALAEARTLLSHSAGGAEYVLASQRIGSMLASAADQAETIRAAAENHRSVARAQAEVIAADARRVLAEAESGATQLLTEAAAQVAAMTDEARRVLAEAERAGREVRAEADGHLAQARAVETLALEQAERIRRQALEDAGAARLAARAEVVRMLETARAQRRRTDAEASAVRDGAERDAATRRAALLAETAQLEQRRETLRAELETVPEPVVASSGALYLHARAYLERIQGRLGRHVPPGGTAAGPTSHVPTRTSERTAA
ncbi:MAG: Exonuclease SbcC [uncultured Blastococcus sp.]|uniref:Exonuclease SbcC n=1 Tax=uncultured Blastococcus sp. TaxID=217144 RepID=A0A6J4I0E8_9ACTN|nr:MAG: Exonuclease SbcC [uncultured Blastococcus sp.]